MAVHTKVQPKNSLQFQTVQNEKQLNAVCQASESKPATLVYFLLNGQLIKQPLYKHLQLGDLITSRKKDDPLVSSTLSLRIPLAGLSTISQLVNSIEYRQFKVDAIKHENSIRFKSARLDASRYDSIRTDSTSDSTMKTNLLSEFTQLTNQQIEHQIGLDDVMRSNSKHYRTRRSVLNELDLNKQTTTLSRLDNQVDRPVKQTSQHRINNANRMNNGDQLLKNARSTNGLTETRLSETINQVNGSINSIEMRLDNRTGSLKNSINSRVALHGHNALNSSSSGQTDDPLDWPASSKVSTAKLNRRTSNSSASRISSTSSSSPDLSPPNSYTHNYKLASISHRLAPRSEALIFDANEDKLANENDLSEPGRGLELSCVSTIAQPIATTYDELSLEENSYLERKPEQSDRHDLLAYVQDEFSVPRIVTNDELSISPGQILTANCSVNLAQHWSLYRLQPILKWYINDREVCTFTFTPFFVVATLLVVSERPIYSSEGPYTEGSR